MASLFQREEEQALYLEIVDALAPLVHEQRRGLRVGRLDPRGQQLPLVGLVPQVLVQVSVGDLFEGLNVVDGHEMRVQIHELDADLFEGALRQQVTLDSRQGLVGVVVGLSKIMRMKYKHYYQSRKYILSPVR